MTYMNRQKQRGNVHHPPHRRHLLLNLLYLLLHQSLLALSSSTASNIPSPIPNLSASLVASSSHTTIIALQVEVSSSRRQIVLLTHSPPTSPPSNLTIAPTTTSSPHIFSLRPQTSLAFVGFTPDVDHLKKKLSKEALDDDFIYGSDGGGGNGRGDEVVRAVSSWLGDAASGGGERPFGVQVLIAEGGRRGGVYTVDCSGAWRYWGSGVTAIGRNAAWVRRRLYDRLTTTLSTRNSSVEDMVALAMDVMREERESRRGGGEEVTKDDKTEEERMLDAVTVVIVDDECRSRGGGEVWNRERLREVYQKLRGDDDVGGSD